MSSKAPRRFLPYGWKEKKSIRKGKRFYFNIYTGESKWDVPPLVTKEEFYRQRDKIEEELHKKKSEGKLRRQQKAKLAASHGVGGGGGGGREGLDYSSVSTESDDEAKVTRRPDAPRSPVEQVDQSTDINSEKPQRRESPTQSFTVSSTVQDSATLSADEVAMMDVDEVVKEPVDLSTKAAYKVCVIVDTNVLINDLKYLQDLKDQTFGILDKPLIVIPWVCMQELDGLKSSEGEVQSNARSAIKFINNCLVNRHPRVVGQSKFQDMDASDPISTSNDDRVINCCLQLNKQRHLASLDQSIILFTIDQNLVNKCLVNDIGVFTRDTIEAGLETLQNATVVAAGSSAADGRPRTPTYTKTASPVQPPIQAHTTVEGISQTKLLIDEVIGIMKSNMRDLLAAVVETEMKLAYGEMWRNIVLKKPPWCFEDTLFLLEKHWIAVFGMVTEKEAKSDVTLLRKHFTKGAESSLDMTGLKSVLDSSSSLSQQYLSSTQYGGQAKSVLIRLRELRFIIQKVISGEVAANDLKTLELVVVIPKEERDKFGSKQRDRRSGGDRKLKSPDNEDDSFSEVDADKAGDIVMGWFQLVWESMNDYCTSLHEQDRDEADTNRKIRIARRLFPVIKNIRDDLNSAIETPPPKINPKSPCEAFHAVTAQLKKYMLSWGGHKNMSQLPKLVEASHLALYFKASTDNRQILSNGVDQADEFLDTLNQFQIQLGEDPLM